MLVRLISYIAFVENQPASCSAILGNVCYSDLFEISRLGNISLFHGCNYCFNYFFDNPHGGIPDHSILAIYTVLDAYLNLV